MGIPWLGHKHIRLRIGEQRPAVPPMELVRHSPHEEGIHPGDRESSREIVPQVVAVQHQVVLNHIILGNSER